MTPDDRFGQTLSTWLHEEAGHRVPSHLGEVLVQTAATRQRPWWSSLERLLPMTMTTRVQMATPRPALVLAIVAALVLCVAAIALVAGGRRSVPAPFGLAANGRILVVDGTTLRSFDASGANPIDVMEVPGGARSLTISPDGTRVASQVDSGLDSTITIVSVDGSNPATFKTPVGVSADPIGWSPDGSHLVFAGWDGGADRLYVLRSDFGGGLTMPGAESIDPSRSRWSPAWSPDGSLLSFVLTPVDGYTGDLWVIRPDGRDARMVATDVFVGNGSTVTWAPDPAVQRLLYGSGESVKVVDVVAGAEHVVRTGFWPSWSPDGSKIALFDGKLRIVDTADALAGNPTTIAALDPQSVGCAERASLERNAICLPVGWSPDGTQVLAADNAGRALLITPADGSANGTGKVVPLGASSGPGIKLVWQPLR